MLETEKQNIIYCKDCNKWLTGNELYSNEGYCSKFRIITGKNCCCAMQKESN